MSTASLNKPTNTIKNTLTPSCACNCHQLLCTSQQTPRTHSHHPVPWVDLSPATLYNYKPTNIIMNTFTPPCACDCHQPVSTSQRMPQTLTSSCVFWASRVMILSCSLTSDSSLERNMNNGRSLWQKKNSDNKCRLLINCSFFSFFFKKKSAQRHVASCFQVQNML